MSTAPLVSYNPVADSPASMATVSDHRLRVLVVDDNSLNLSMLTRLLRKRFSHMLDDAPVAVDSGLKALQLLRDNVYDVILMDIQMPFISGVDCTQRIRKGLDGVLAANQHATILAVTTATGSEPEAVYRRNGFDGLIAKPVQHEAMAEFLVPLLAAAREAESKVRKVVINGVEHTPALPVTPLEGDRLFFLPSLPQTSSDAPAITRSANFEALLNEQTRVSLERYGACALARTGSIAGVSDRRLLRKYDDDRNNFPSTTSTRTHASPSSPRIDVVGEPSVEEPKRRTSLSISQSTLNEQLQREMDAAHLPTGSTPDKPVPSLKAYKWPTVDVESQSRSLEQARQDEPLSPYDHLTFVDGLTRLASLRRPSLCPIAPHFYNRFEERRASSGAERSVARNGSSSSTSSSSDPSSLSERSSSLATEGASEVSPLTTPSSETQFDLTVLGEERKASSSYTPTMTSPLSSNPYDELQSKQPQSLFDVVDYSSSVDDDQRTLTDDRSSIADSNDLPPQPLVPKKRPLFRRFNASPDLQSDGFASAVSRLSLSTRPALAPRRNTQAS